MNDVNGMEPLTAREKVLLVLLLVGAFLPLLLPAIEQDQAYHRFADTRRFLGVPNALDSLSNLLFVVLACWGLGLQWTKRLWFETPALRRLATLLLVGFITTGFGSFLYHVNPNDAGLIWDRAGMVIAFAGVMGMVAAHKISPRAGYGLAVLGLLAGPLSVWWWAHSHSLTPYAIVQFGGIALVIWLACLSSSVKGPQWKLFIALYALAKVFETFDSQVFEAIGMLISGHTLKHLVSASTALVIIWPEWRRRQG